VPLTGILGGPYSQPGDLQPGYAITQGQAQWLGPFAGISPTIGGFDRGATVSVTAAVAGELVASDPSWWMAH
jgi:hypothetical protein